MFDYTCLIERTNQIRKQLMMHLQACSGYRILAGNRELQDKQTGRDTVGCSVYIFP